MKEILWKDIKIGDKFLDNSQVIQIHGIHKIDCMNIKTKNESILVSEDHLFLCDISKMKKKYRENILAECKKEKIPLEIDQIIFSPEIIPEDMKEDIFKSLENGNLNSKYDVQEIIIKDESKIYDVNKCLVWLTTLELNRIYRLGHVSSGGNKIESICYKGEFDAFCVSTNTGKYITNIKGMIHHNSVTIRSIIFHCLTHGVKIGMIDLKFTEFENYKGNNGVLGVANNTEEALELLRICRSLMYKRNKILAKAGVVDIINFKPKEKTDKITIFGREYKDTDKLIMKDDDGNESEITFEELLKTLA